MSPPDERCRPAPGPAPNTTTTVDTGQRSGRCRHTPERHASRGQLLLEQLARRHETAKRLPPLPHSRRRDPLSPRELADCRERR